MKEFIITIRKRHASQEEIEKGDDILTSVSVKYDERNCGSIFIAKSLLEQKEQLIKECIISEIEEVL